MVRFKKRTTTALKCAVAHTHSDSGCPEGGAAQDSWNPILRERCLLLPCKVNALLVCLCALLIIVRGPSFPYRC